MYGCDIVWPSPMVSGRSSYAICATSGETNSCRGTRAIAASTRSSRMSRARSWVSTICSRCWLNWSGSRSGHMLLLLTLAHPDLKTEHAVLVPHQHDGKILVHLVLRLDH